ncbi:MAG: glycosyl hydrolase family 28 protein [Hungatella sp.]
MMGSMGMMRSMVTEDAITLYWEKTVAGKSEYRILLDGIDQGYTEKTHYTLDNLEPEREYRIRIEKVSDHGDHKLPAESEECFLTTEKKKLRRDITKAPYDAIGDGKTMNTRAIQQALDDCKSNEMVYIPSGIFLTGALRLHSDMELYIDRDGVLQGTDVVEDYLPRIWSRFEGTELECYSSLLNLGELNHEGGYPCQNVAIRGKGTIASGGRSLAQKVITSERERLSAYLDSMGDRILECEKPETIPGRVRPRLINMSNCRNIVLSGLTLKNGASWNVHMIYSDSIVTNDCTFYSENVWNGDGWDPDSSSNCTIFNCTFYTGDDSIAIKSGKNPEGNAIDRPSRHIRIFDCRCAFGHGITMGSEMSGGIEDVAIWDCDMSSSMFGIEIKGTKKRGGYVRNISVRDSLVARILFHSVGYNDDGIGALMPPVFEDCIFDHVQIMGEYLSHDREWVPCEALELCGFDEPGYELKNLIFSNLSLGRPGQKKKQTFSLQMCENITFYNISNAR